MLVINSNATLVTVNKRLVILDSLRGVASLIVLFHHFFKINLQYLNKIIEQPLFDIAESISNLNHEAVLFFFILSGFSIGLSLKDQEIADVSDVNLYYYKRLRRILPIYWLSLIFTFIVGVVVNSVESAEYGFLNLIGNLLFLQTSEAATNAWFTPYGYNGPLWSLAFEFFFYLIFPIFFWIDKKILNQYNSNAKFVLLLITTLVSIILNKIIFVPYLLFFGKFILWVLGYLISRFYHLKKKYNLIFIIATCFSALYLGVVQQFFVSNSINVLSLGLLMGSIFYFVIIIDMNNRFVFISKCLLFISKILNIFYAKIGRGSFAIYAFHYPLLILLDHFKIALSLQVVIVMIFIKICIVIEDYLVKLKFSFLNIKYLPA